MEKKQKKSKKVPHTLVILLIVALFAILLTWIIPSGKYERYENEAGIKVIDPTTFTYIEQTPVNPLKIFNLAMAGFKKSATLIFVILFSGAAFNVVTESGALQAAIWRASEKTKNKGGLFIPILTLVFGLICTVKGVNTFIGFAPVMVVIALSLGYDSIVGAGIILLGGAVGFSTGTLNPSTTIVAQEIAGLPAYSGFGYRAFCFVVFYIFTNIYLVKYANKIKKNPELSPMYDLDKQRNLGADMEDPSLGGMNTRRWLVLLSLVVALGVMVYGGVQLDWGLEETGAIFIWLAVIAGAIAGFGPSEIAKSFIRGAKNMVGAALIIGFARTISGILDEGQIMDTSIMFMTSSMNSLPQLLKGPVMYIVNIIVNIFITSGSGQAGAVMPIFAPLADVIGITRQTAVLAFNFGDGFCNYILPTSTALMGTLGATDIPYDRWMKFMWKLFLIWVAVGSVLMVGAQLINLGPM